MASAAAMGSNGDRLKDWLISRLQPISNAEPSVLADYVLALLRHDRSDDELRRSCLDQLDDFLRSQTRPFVDDLFSHITGSSSSRKRGLSPHSAADDDYASKQARGASGLPMPPAMNGNGFPQGMPIPVSYEGGPMPQWEGRGRGRGAPRGGRGRGRGRGMPMMGGQMGPMGPMMAGPMAGPMGGDGDVDMAGGGPRQKKMHVCRDYHFRGYCARGESCQFLHDEALNPAIAGLLPPGSLPSNVGPPGGGGSSGGPSFSPFQPPPFPSGVGGPQSGFSRPFNSNAPTTRSNTVLVIEQIPPDSLSEEAVRSYFAKFGALADVAVHKPSKQALVTFANAEEAKTARDCPDSVFGNRFVKVYFQRKLRDQGQSNFVAPGVADKAAGAGEKANGDVKMDEAGPSSAADATEGGDKPVGEGVSAEKAELLRTLREKAAALGIDISKLGADPATSAARGRGRGRGRGAFRGGWTPAGRGRGAMATGASLKLDNRPTTLAVTGIADAASSEKLKAYFESFGPVVSFAPTADAASAGDVTVQFATRAVAERAIRHGNEVEGVGKVALAWTANPISSVSKAATPSSSTGKATTPMADAAEEDGGDEGGPNEGQGKEEEMYDDDAEEGWKR